MDPLLAYVTELGYWFGRGVAAGNAKLDDAELDEAIRSIYEGATEVVANVVLKSRLHQKLTASEFELLSLLVCVQQLHAVGAVRTQPIAARFLSQHESAFNEHVKEVYETKVKRASILAGLELATEQAVGCAQIAVEWSGARSTVTRESFNLLCGFLTGRLSQFDESPDDDPALEQKLERRCDAAYLELIDGRVHKSLSKSLPSLFPAS